jgi:hypothetical protein
LTGDLHITAAAVPVAQQICPLKHLVAHSLQRAAQVVPMH